MKTKNHLERLTILVGRDDIRRIKHLAVDQRSSTSEIVRSAVKDYLVGNEAIEQDTQTKQKIRA
jgi:hypothetical protein